MNDNRPKEPARRNYTAQHPQEEFIVPLLNTHIEEILNTTTNCINRKAIDVGCGRQPFRSRIEKLGFDYTGADARQNPEYSVDFICEIDKPLSDEIKAAAPFGLVICTEVLEHVANWEQAFENFSTLTDVKSIVLITCPFFYPLHEVPYDFWRPTRYAVPHFAQMKGFRVIMGEGVGDVWDVLGTLVGCVSPYSPSRNLLSKLAWLIRLWAVLATRWMLKLRILPRLFPLKSQVYLSNIFILEKE